MNHRRYSKFLTGLVVSLLVLSVFSNPALASPASGNNIQAQTLDPALNCVAFSPYVESYNPNLGIHPPASLINQLLDTIVKQNYNCILIYGVTPPANHIFQAAQDRGLKVIANIWLELSASKNTGSIQAGIAAAQAYPDTIIRLSCGSEVRTRAVNNGRPVSAAEAVINQCIDQLRAAGITQPITTIDTWWNWCNAQSPCQTWSMANKVDWIGINVYPWWENKHSGLFPCITAAEAPQFHLDRIQDVKTTYPGKEVVLTEFGWPAGPNNYSEVNRFTGQKCGIASKANQDLVVSETRTKLNDAGIQGVGFEAFREPWKKVEGPAGPFWGLMAYIPKPVLKLPASGASVTGIPAHSWLATTTAVAYRFEYDDSSDCKSPLYTSPELTGLSYKPSAQPAGIYYWHVDARNKLGNWSAWSTCRPLSILAFPPPALDRPLNNAMTNVAPSFTWLSVPDADHYEIVIARDLDFTDVADTQMVTTPPFTSAVTLTDGEYYWYMRTYNAFNEPGDWSSTRSFTIDTAATPVPVLLMPAHGEELLHRRATFDWTNVVGATKYRIIASTSSSFKTVLWTVNATTSTYTPSADLPAGKVIYWRVRALVDGAWGTWSGTSNFKTARPPSIPVLVSPANKAIIRDYMPMLDWKNATLPTGGAAFDRYQVQISTDKGFADPLLIDAVTPRDDIKASSFTPDTDLAANRRYYWRVRAFNVDGQYSSWSTVWSFSTALLPPSNLTPDSGEMVSSRKPVLDWDMVTGASGYNIQISTSSRFSTLLVNTTAATDTFTPSTKLPANRMLYWRVRATGTNGPSNWTTTSFHTQ